MEETLTQDTTETTQIETTDAPTSFESFLAEETTQEPSEQSTEEVAETTQDTEEPSEPEGELPPLTWGDESERQTATEGEVTTLDPQILAALEASPEAKKRLEQQWAGFEKVHKQLQEYKPRAEAFGDWVSRLQSESTQEAAIAEMQGLVKQWTGKDLIPAEPDYSDDLVKPHIDPIKKELDDLKAFKAQIETERQQAAWIKANGEKIISGIKAATNGWEVTTEMVVAARSEYPNHPPLEAIKHAFLPQYESFIRSKYEQTKTAKPTLPSGSKGNAVDLTKIDTQESGALFKAFL